MVGTLLLGLALGLRHATDADHVSAMAPLVAREPRPASAVVIAATWGAGHTLSVLALGVPLVAIGIGPPAGFDRVVEGAVALMLVALGARALLASRKANEPRPPSPRPPVRAFIIGSIHGLGGTAGLTLLTASSLPSVRAILFLLVFGAGTVIGMMAATWALARGFAWLTRRSIAPPEAIARIAGLLSIAIGLWLAAECFART